MGKPKMGRTMRRSLRSSGWLTGGSQLTLLAGLLVLLLVVGAPGAVWAQAAPARASATHSRRVLLRSNTTTSPSRTVAPLTNVKSMPVPPVQQITYCKKKA